jgi:hypothetical protein
MRDVQQKVQKAEEDKTIKGEMDKMEMKHHLFQYLVASTPRRYSAFATPGGNAAARVCPYF